MEQDRVAGRERPDPPHQVRGGETAHRHRRRGLAGDRVGQLDQRCSRHDPLGAVRAERVEEAGVGHAVAGRNVGDALAHRLDDARAFDADAVRQRNRIQARPEIRVGEIETDRDVAHARHAGSGRADGDLFNLRTSGPPALCMRTAVAMVVVLFLA
jgi:hypothetical protein